MIIFDDALDAEKENDKRGKENTITTYSDLTPIHLDVLKFKNASMLSIASILERSNVQTEAATEWTFNENSDAMMAFDFNKGLINQLNNDAEDAQPERYSFLLEILDENKRPPSDPEYDGRTLFVPPSACAKFTPFERQYWDIKKKFFDAVVFFKKGKFYELYEKDADIAASRFDLKVTDRVNMKMAGVPEASLELWLQRFIDAGHKVVVVRQLENQIGREIRKKSGDVETPSKGTEDSSIIRREVACVLTSATVTDPQMMSSDFSTFVMSLNHNEAHAGKSTFGVVFIDVSTSLVLYCKFEDDARRYYLETLLLQTKPKEILLEKDAISPILTSFIQKLLPSSSLIYLKSGDEFYSAEKCVTELEKGGYFKKILKTNEGKDILSGKF